MTKCRNGLHEIKSSADRCSHGGCRRCAALSGAAYRRRCREARHKLAAIEAALA